VGFVDLHVRRAAAALRGELRADLVDEVRRIATEAIFRNSPREPKRGSPESRAYASLTSAVVASVPPENSRTRSRRAMRRSSSYSNGTQRSTPAAPSGSLSLSATALSPVACGE
jgi:hypothetical protein